MRRTATKTVEPLYDSSGVYEGKCVSCEEPVTVSAYALDICKMANHVLKKMGEKLMTKAEIAMCRACYLKHNSAMWAKERQRSDGYVKAWNSFKGAYKAAKDDEEREMLEKKLRLGFGDYWPSYSALFVAWKSELQTKRAKGTKDSTSKAGF